jgi:hypothetical protein
MHPVDAVHSRDGTISTAEPNIVAGRRPISRRGFLLRGQLSDAELDQLEKILVKIGGATAAGPAIGADDAGRPASGTATPAQIAFSP